MHEERDPLLSPLVENPVLGASEGFTERVLARYAKRRRRRAAVRGAVAAALLLGAAGLAWMRATTPEVDPQIHSLQAEQRQLAAELARLEELARTTRPVAWVHAGEDLDVVLDLRRLDAAGGLDARPATYTTSAREP
ncbi:MAG: hypothetical protein ACRD2Z_16470 [Thermoanaerobaculia bacterium]